MNDADLLREIRLSPERMRALGYRAIDLLVEHLERLPDKPVTRHAGRAEMAALLDEPPPEEPTPPEEVLEMLAGRVFAHTMHLDHPRFFAFVPGPGNFVGALGDALAAGFNIFAGAWIEAAGPAQVELTTMDWVRRLCGFPEGTRGHFVSGGSLANLTALAVARHAQLDDRVEGAVVYMSEQAHYSVQKGLRLLGFAPHQVRALPVDEAFRLDVGALEQAIGEDRAAGRRPFCVVASCGTTNTGAVDPLEPLAALCEAEGLWLHVDGAYGAAAVICERAAPLMAGLGRAHSLALDPHKWWFQPYEAGCVLVREGARLAGTFSYLPEYLRDVEAGGGEVNFKDEGVQLTRAFRALKLWMSFKVFGLRAYREAIARGIERAEQAQRLLEGMPGWEVVTPARLAVVTFRCRPPGLSEAQADALTGRLVERMIADGYAFAGSTVLNGRAVLRMCTINPRLTEEDIRETLARLDRFATEEAGKAD